MVASIMYALILWVHPVNQPEVHDTFRTAEECRVERLALLDDLPDISMIALCQPVTGRRS